METILKIVGKGVGILLDLIPKWVASSAEERVQLEKDADAEVDKLGAKFKAADERDAKNFQRAEDAIAGE